jgi:hypothetical protein
MEVYIFIRNIVISNKLIYFSTDDREKNMVPLGCYYSNGSNFHNISVSFIFVKCNLLNFFYVSFGTENFST